ncbi:reverse transcriptase [Trichonephila clavipes]|nr:reverse transcriptase [Trichonephila clavipes]
MNLTWRNPPAHHWYAAKSPGLSIQCRSSSTHQTDLARFRSGHLRSMTFVQREGRESVKDDKLSRCLQISRIAENIKKVSAAVRTALTTKTKSLGKPWKTLDIMGPIPRHLEKVKAVARFRLTTGHDFLGVYLYWIDLAVDEACPLCGHARMDGDHLLECTGLDEYPTDDVVSRYWETQRQMVKKPSMGVE